MGSRPAVEPSVLDAETGSCPRDGEPGNLPVIHGAHEPTTVATRGPA